MITLLPCKARLVRSTRVLALVVGTFCFNCGPNPVVAQTARIELQRVERIGEHFSIDIVMEFPAQGRESTDPLSVDPAEPPADNAVDPNVVFFSLDVSDSDGQLAPASDFSAFSFNLNSELSEWTQIPNTGFSAAASSIEFDTIFQPLPPGRHNLGTLRYDAMNVDSSALPAVVSVNANGTSIGFQTPNDPSSFDFATLEYSPGEVMIPEPIGFLGFLMAMAITFSATRKRLR